MNATATVREVTPDDLLQMPGGGKGFELIDGELRERNVSFLSSYVAGEVCDVLKAFVKPRTLGWVSPEGVSFRCFPFDDRRVRRADVAFIALARFTVEQATSEGHCTVCPDLVVEVTSPHDLAHEVNAKVDEWLAAGARLVWVVNPHAKRVTAFRAGGQPVQFRGADALTAEPVLPGFSCPVADLFRLPAAGGASG